MTDHDDVKWIRKLSFHEELHEHAQLNETLTIVDRYSLASTQPIEEDVIRTALQHWYRKVPNLRLAIRRKDGELWFCEMEKEIIDFKVTSNANEELEFEKVGITPYDSYNGPLWRVQFQQEPNKRCHLPELAEEFPFQSTLIIGAHHGITDGHSQHMQFGLLLRIVNDIIDGKAIDDEQFGYIADGEEIKEIISSREEEFNNNPELLETVQNKLMDAFTGKTLLSTITNNHETEEPRSLHITATIDANTNKKLYLKFKSLGVTFNSGFGSFVDLVFIEMLQEKGIDLDEYTITSYHAVNSRRYWKREDRDFGFGTYYMATLIQMKVSHDVRSKLAEYMKNYHQELLSNIENETPFDIEIFSRFNEDGTPFDVNAHMKNLPPVSSYYSSSNMKDTTKMLGTDGKHVQLVWYTRSTSIKNMDIPIILMFQTFRGQLIIGFDYSTRYIPTEIAKDILNRIVKQCEDFVK